MLQTSELIQYIFISIIIFYVIEKMCESAGISSSRIFLFLSIFVIVLAYMRWDLVSLYLPVPVKTDSTVIEKITDTLQNAEIPGTSKFKEAVDQLISYIKKLDMPTILQALEVHFALYNKQLSEITNKANNSPQLAYSSIKDIERDINQEIQGLYFNLESNQYVTITNIVKSLESAMIEIDIELEKRINRDFKANPMSSKCPVVSVGLPAAYNT